MDHTVNIGMGIEDFVEILLLPYIDLMKKRSFSAYQFDAIERLLRGVVKIVGNDYLVAGFKQS